MASAQLDLDTSGHEWRERLFVWHGVVLGAWCVCVPRVNRGRICAGVHPGPSKHGPDEYQNQDLDQAMRDLKDMVTGTVQIDSGCSLVRRYVNPPICIMYP